MSGQMGGGHSSELKDLEKPDDLRYGQGFSRAAAENVDYWEEIEKIVYFCRPALLPFPVVAPEWVKRSESTRMWRERMDCGMIRVYIRM